MENIVPWSTNNKLQQEHKTKRYCFID